MTITPESLAEIKESLPKDIAVQAIVCGPLYKQKLKDLYCGTSRDPPVTSFNGMRVFDLIEMDSYDRTLVFNDLQDAIGFVRMIDVLRDYGESELVEEIIDVFMSKANTLDNRGSK